MSEERYSRTLKLIGQEGLAKLRAARVIVIGCGGVGSYAAEACTRAGIGHLTFMDGDTVAQSNLNRQLVALTSTIGRNKAEVMAERARDIDPETVRYAREDFLYSNKVDEYEDALDVALNEISLRTADTPYDDRLSAKIARKLDGKGFSRADIFRVLDELRRRYE